MTLDVSVARADETARPAQRVESLRLDATGVVQGWFAGGPSQAGWSCALRGAPDESLTALVNHTA